MMLALVEEGVLDLPTLVRLACTQPAELFAVERRGAIREGWHADLVLLDETAHSPVTAREVLSRCAWTPLEGRTLPGRIDAVWVNGHLSWQNGQAGAPMGQALRFRGR